MNEEFEREALEKWVARPLVRGSGLHAITEIEQLGSKLSRSWLRISLASEEGENVYQLWKRASSQAHSAYLEHDMVVLNEFLDASNRIEAFAKKALKDEEFKVLKDEVDRQREVIRFRFSTVDEPMPDFARLRAITSPADRVLLATHSAYYQGTFIDQISSLATKTNISASEQMAITTFRRMRQVIGHQMDEGWSRVFEDCVKNMQKLVQTSQELRRLEAAIAKQGENALLRKQMSDVLNIIFWTIRGDLGEIYLHHWPPWRLMLSSMEEIAAGSARRLGKGWRSKAFSGGVLIDGKKAWDEGILLLKSPGPGDRIPRAALHTAAQVKVETRLSALEQTVKDSIREIGQAGTLPRLSIIEGGKRQDFVLEALPPDIEVVRFAFNASGEDLVLGKKLLMTRGLQVKSMPLDISIEEFHALARQVVDTAPVYLGKLKPPP